MTATMTPGSESQNPEQPRLFEMPDQEPQTDLPTPVDVFGAVTTLPQASASETAVITPEPQTATAEQPLSVDMMEDIKAATGLSEKEINKILAKQQIKLEKATKAPAVEQQTAEPVANRVTRRAEKQDRREEKQAVKKVAKTESAKTQDSNSEPRPLMFNSLDEVFNTLKSKAATASDEEWAKLRSETERFERADAIKTGMDSPEAVEQSVAGMLDYADSLRTESKGEVKTSPDSSETSVNPEAGVEAETTAKLRTLMSEMRRSRIEGNEQAVIELANEARRLNDEAVKQGGGTDPAEFEKVLAMMFGAIVADAPKPIVPGEVLIKNDAKPTADTKTKVEVSQEAKKDAKKEPKRRLGRTALGLTVVVAGLGIGALVANNLKDSGSNKQADKTEQTAVPTVESEAPQVSEAPVISVDQSPENTAPATTDSQPEPEVSVAPEVPEATVAPEQPAVPEATSTPEPETSAEQPADVVEPEEAVEATTPEPTPEDIDASAWSWDVANQLAPGNEVAFIQKGIDAYNAAHGTNFVLKPVNGTTMIVDGSHIVSPEEMQIINQLMLA